MTTPTPAPNGGAGNPVLDAVVAKLNQLAANPSSGSSSTSDPAVPARTKFGRAGFGTTNFSLSGQGDIGRFRPQTGDLAAGILGDKQDPDTGGYTATRKSSDVKLDVQRMSDDELEALGERLVTAGLLDSNWNLSDGGRDAIEKEWGTLVDRAAAYHLANPQTDLTPDDMIDLYGNKSGAGGAKPSTTVTTYTAKPMDAAGARKTLTSMMSGALGRAPTQREVDDFQAALNAAQANSPSAETTTSYVDAKGIKHSDTVASGGVDVGGFTSQYEQEHVRNTNEYKHYQAATTYMNALMEAIRGPAGIQPASGQ